MATTIKFQVSSYCFFIACFLPGSAPVFPEVLEVELKPLLTATKRGWDKVNNSSPVDVSACGSNPSQYWGGSVRGEEQIQWDLLEKVAWQPILDQTY